MPPQKELLRKELGVALPSTDRKTGEVITPPGIRIVRGEPIFIKELERAVKSCFSYADARIADQLLSRLPYAYLKAVNVANVYNYYGKTRKDIIKKLDYYYKKQGDAVKRIVQARSPETKPLSKRTATNLNEIISWATEHIEQAEIALGAFAKNSGKPIDWFRRCLLMELFHVYAVVKQTLPTQAGETWNIVAWVLQNYHKAHVVRDPFHWDSADHHVSPRDVYYLQHQWHAGNRRQFPKDTLKNWPKLTFPQVP